MPDPLTPIGFHNYRGNKEEKFGIKLDDRRRHVYIVGKTGVGKTTLLENMAIADIKSGKGVCVVDPHGEFAEKLLDFVPEERLDDVIYFDPSDMEFPIAFNPMEQVGTEFRHLVASSLMGVFKKIWADAWSARMQYILNNTLLSLLEFPDATLLGILRMFSEPNYRKKIVDNLRDPVIKAFWQNEFSKYSQKFETEALAAIQNKVGQFVTNPLVRNILGQPRSTLNMRQMMDTGKIFIANLSKGKIGEDNSSLLGAMIITRLQLAAMSRVDIPEDKRRDFFMYVDEFQNFATDSFASILSEARKYRLSLVLAHQYISQLIGPEGNTKVRDAVFGNVGTIVTFRIGAADAEFLEMEFMPEFLQNDLVNLAKANIYIKLMIDGVSSRPFSAQTLPPQKPPLVSYRDVIIKNSQQHYGTPRQVVEDRILAEWSGKSDDVVQEKITRRNEQGLSQALRPGAPGQSAPRSGGQGGQDSGPRPFQSPVSRPGGQQRPDFSRHSNPGPSQPEPVRPGGLPERRNTTFNTPGRVVPPRIVNTPASAPVSTPAVSMPSTPSVHTPANSSSNSHPAHSTPAAAPVLRTEVVAKPQKPKHVPKNNIDIAELRRAISESLKRPGVSPEHPSVDQAPKIDPINPAQ